MRLGEPKSVRRILRVGSGVFLIPRRVEMRLQFSVGKSGPLEPRHLQDIFPGIAEVIVEIPAGEDFGLRNFGDQMGNRVGDLELGLLRAAELDRQPQECPSNVHGRHADDPQRPTHMAGDRFRDRPFRGRNAVELIGISDDVLADLVTNEAGYEAVQSAG